MNKVQEQTSNFNSLINEWITADKITTGKINPREKDEKEMNVMPNFNFGPCGDRAKISPLGIAVQNSNNEWVSYDKDNNQIVNVDLINFGSNNFVYMVPVALKDVSVGDAVIHNKHIMFVNKVKDNGLSVIDVTDGEYKKILPTKSIFGFDFITKVVSLVDFSASTASEDNPFGNMLPFLLLGNKDMNKENLSPLALMLLLNQGASLSDQIGSKSGMSSSMLMVLACLEKTGNSMSEALPLMMIMNPTLFSKNQ